MGFVPFFCLFGRDERCGGGDERGRWSFQKDFDAILLMGMYAQHCVMATYWGAFDQGLSPYLMKGGLISTDQKYCELAVELCKHFTMEELESNLEIHGKK